MSITVEYDGAYPNLCSGKLIVTVCDTRWEFPDYCLASGGSVWFGKDWAGHIEYGPWSVSRWPDGFPEDQKEAVIEAINENIPHGCCGGCI